MAQTRQQMRYLDVKATYEKATLEIERLETALKQAQWERDRTVEVQRLSEERHKAELDQMQKDTLAHTAVILGDRDALTRALEVCTRRLASPQADKDFSRAGWRAQRTEAFINRGEEAMRAMAQPSEQAGRLEPRS